VVQISPGNSSVIAEITEIAEIAEITAITVIAGDLLVLP
jgi:hypothetical protein